MPPKKKQKNSLAKVTNTTPKITRVTRNTAGNFFMKSNMLKNYN